MHQRSPNFLARDQQLYAIVHRPLIVSGEWQALDTIRHSRGIAAKLTEPFLYNQEVIHSIS